jgi:hypothetical protein
MEERVVYFIFATPPSISKWGYSPCIEFTVINYKTRKMKKVEIISGNFATGEENQGNFNGYDSDGQRYFISKRLLSSHKWEKDADVKFPFWAKVGVKQINQLVNPKDPNSDLVMKDGVPVVVDRLQVLSIFKSEQELIDHEVNKASLDIKIQAGVKAAASTAGLSDKSIEALLLASVA